MFSSRISNKSADYAFVQPDNGSPDVFLHRSSSQVGLFDKASVGAKVQFQTRFSASGAVGVLSGAT
ncbi:cold shock domain-containing protein [Bradyrhizobium sp. 76]|nr:cold shock domain-containing protein [Bradyrhizobium sp. 76]